MDIDLRFAFQNISDPKSIRRQVERQVRSLERKFEGIESCLANFNVPYSHRYPGNIYDFKIEVSVPGNKVSAARHPSIDGASANVFSLIRDAFAEIEQKLDLCACARESEEEKKRDIVKRSAKERKPKQGKTPHLYRRPVSTGKVEVNRARPAH